MLSLPHNPSEAVPVVQTPSLAVLLFDPFPLYLAQRTDPSLLRAPVVCVEEQRVVHATPEARRRGVTLGMRLTGARMRVEGLRVVQLDEPSVQHAWNELLREVHEVTPWLESPRRGRVFAHLEPSEAASLAEGYGARVGIAGSREIAELAAVSARPGHLRRVDPGDEARFFEQLPLRFLKGVGASDKNLTRLHWLGLKTVADLARWSGSQLRSYLAEEGESLLPYLHGPYSTRPRPFELPATLRRSITFEELAREPFELLPALERLSASLERGLDGRASRRLTLTAGSSAGQRRVTRLSKRPLTRAPQIRQQALFALDDSGAAPLGIERLTVELAAPQRLGLQGGLWRAAERREEAQSAALERFPGAIVRFAWRDPYAPADDLAWGWETVPGPDDAPPAATREQRRGADPRTVQALTADRRSVVQASAVPLFSDLPPFVRPPTPAPSPSAADTPLHGPHNPHDLEHTPAPSVADPDPTPALPFPEDLHASAHAAGPSHPTRSGTRHRELASPLR